MIYEVKRLTNEELQHLYIRESNKLVNSINLKINYNNIQSLKLNVSQLNRELRRRKLAGHEKSHHLF